MKKPNWKKWGVRGVLIGVLGAVGVNNPELAFAIADTITGLI